MQFFYLSIVNIIFPFCFFVFVPIFAELPYSSSSSIIIINSTLPESNPSQEIESNVFEINKLNSSQKYGNSNELDNPETINSTDLEALKNKAYLFH